MGALAIIGLGTAVIWSFIFLFIIILRVKFSNELKGWVLMKTGNVKQVDITDDAEDSSESFEIEDKNQSYDIDMSEIRSIGKLIPKNVLLYFEDRSKPISWDDRDSKDKLEAGNIGPKKLNYLLGAKFDNLLSTLKSGKGVNTKLLLINVVMLVIVSVTLIISIAG